VSPRGLGTVNVTDLLFRYGAYAILATLVPIDVRRNATLMVELFTRKNLVPDAQNGAVPNDAAVRAQHEKIGIFPEHIQERLDV
jgi:hypothetical protein